MIQLGVLDLGKGMAGVPDEKIIDHTIGSAKLAEANGYSKYWLAEHHDHNMAWRSPEILMAILAGYTDTISIGAGGILLPLNSPLRVAQHFKMLATLFPGRIDLGIGKGLTIHTHIANQLLNGVSSNDLLKDHDRRLELLLKFLEDYTVDPEGRYLETPPYSGKVPAMWVLGTSGGSADVLIRNKCAFSFSIMHTVPQTISERAIIFNDIIKRYEDEHSQPLQRNLAVGVICGSNQAETERIKNYHAGGTEINISGTPDECAEQLKMAAEQFNVQEVLLHIISDSFENRHFAIEAIAGEINVLKQLS